MRKDREAIYGPILRQAFVAQGLPGAWGMAFARQESDFVANTQNTSADDMRLGGSYGLCQMSLATAKGLGYTGDVAGLKDPHINAALAAKLCAQLSKKYRGRLEDVASAYNSGRPLALAPRASTRDVYVPNIVRYVAEYT